MTQLQNSRQIHFIFQVALFSLLLLGGARLVLDFLKNKEHQLNWQSYFAAETKVRPNIPLTVSQDEIIEDECNVFDGQWIWDNASYPLYREDSCPFLVKQVTCQRNGRPDSLYQNWRWQPNGCNLPRFNALKLLEIIRDKRLMFVGDSIQRGMFESMVCLVQSAISVGKNSIQRIPPRKVFTIQEYNATIEYYWAPFLVESISDHATNHTVLKRLVKLDAIAKHSKQWEGVDFLVFESYVWWMHKPRINATYGSSDDVREFNVTNAYRLAMETWANWIESSMKKQKVFFVTMSPTHLWSWEWSPERDGNCYKEAYPIEGPYWGTGSNQEIMSIVKNITRSLKVNVQLLNITQMSEYRKDGHTSIYGERKGKLLTKEQRSNPKLYSDCIHWCLPGVPDAWNEILYALLLQDYR